jgi:hypothetical protein
MEPLFRLTCAKRDDPGIENWFFDPALPLRSILRPCYADLRDLGEEVGFVLHDGAVTACLGDAAFAYLAAFRAHAALGFFRGAHLRDPARLLQGTGKSMRHVKLHPGRLPATAALQDLITAAHADIRVALASDRIAPRGPFGFAP